MEFNNIFMITVIAAAFICFRLEVEGAISTEELTPEQKQDCVKWEEFNSGYCPPGTYKNDTDGNCPYCPEGTYMKWYNTCPMCIIFKVCVEGDVVSYPGDTKNDRICTDPPPATDPQLIIDSSTPSESKKHKPYTEGSTSPTPHDLPDPTSKNSSEPPATGTQRYKLSTLGLVLIICVPVALFFAGVVIVLIRKCSGNQNTSQRDRSSSTSTTNDTSENDKESNASLIAPNSNSEVIIKME